MRFPLRVSLRETSPRHRSVSFAYLPASFEQSSKHRGEKELSFALRNIAPTPGGKLRLPPDEQKCSNLSHLRFSHTGEKNRLCLFFRGEEGNFFPAEKQIAPISAENSEQVSSVHHMGKRRSRRRRSGADSLQLLFIRPGSGS